MELEKKVQLHKRVTGPGFLKRHVFGVENSVHGTCVSEFLVFFFALLKRIRIYGRDANVWSLMKVPLRVCFQNSIVAGTQFGAEFWNLS